VYFIKFSAEPLVSYLTVAGTHQCVCHPCFEMGQLLAAYSRIVNEIYLFELKIKIKCSK